MTEIIALSAATIGGEEIQTVNARDLHAVLGVKTEFKDWIARRIKDFGFVENTDFCSFLSESSGGRPSKEFSVSLGMAKELAMVERNAKGKQARLYFIECEKIAKAKATAPALPDYPTALRQLASSLEKQAALEHKVAEDAPKVAFAETVEASYGDMLIREAAKTLGYPATLLFDWLRAHSWITMKNEPYADRVKQGVLRPRVSNFTHPEKGLSVSITAHVTPKGLYRLYQALLKEGKVTRNERLEQTAG